MKLKTLILAAVLLAAFIAPAFSQEMPAPGTVIDKNNYKKYAHLIPEEFLAAFENGFGIFSPIKMNVVVSKHPSILKKFMEYSMKNKGKFGIDAQGNITGGWAYDGLPFPDVQKTDKDFALKLMWNYQGKYMWDDQDDSVETPSFEKRKGEPLRWNAARSLWPIFKNRMACQQKPYLDNPIGLYKALVFHYTLPESIKNTITLSYRYADLNKTDETYLYLPAMRRVLRAEAGQRSTPMLGSTQALDDFNGGFDGNTNQFKYTLVKEQKVLASYDPKITAPQAKAWRKDDLPFEYNGYEVRDTYVIDVVAKDPKYPQGKKRLWIDKDTLNALYSVTWDRSGKIWKMWTSSYAQYSIGKETFTVLYTMFGIDIQFGMATNFINNSPYNACKSTYNDVTPAALLKRAR